MAKQSLQLSIGAFNSIDRHRSNIVAYSLQDAELLSDLLTQLMSLLPGGHVNLCNCAGSGRCT